MRLRKLNRMKILAIGNIFLSTSIIAENFCTKDSEIYADTLQNKISGAAIIISAVSAFLNIDATLCTKSVKNQRVDILFKKLESLGVCFEFVQADETSDANTMISIYNQYNERHCYTFLPNEVSAEDLQLIDYSKYDVVFFCCIPYKEIKCLLDKGKFPIAQKTIIIASGLTYQYLDVKGLKVFPDYIFMNAGELRGSLGVEEDDWLSFERINTGDTKVIITMGKDGVVIKNNDVVSQYPVSDETNNIVHPGGAGDSFAAGYMAGQLKGWDDKESVSLGHKCAMSLLSVNSVEEYIDKILKR